VNVKAFVYEKVNVYKEQRFEPGNRRWEFYMTILYMVFMLILALGFFIAALVKTVQTSETLKDDKIATYNLTMAIINNPKYDSVTCPCTSPKIAYGDISKLDWISYPLCLKGTDLEGFYTQCKASKTCRTGQAFKFQLLSFLYYLCPVSDSFANNEVNIYKSRTVSSSSLMSVKSFVDELSFYENVVQENVRSQLSTPISISRALSYVNRPLNPNFVVESVSGGPLKYNPDYTTKQCFCDKDYLCEVQSTSSYQLKCSNLETYMELNTNQSLGLLGDFLDIKPIQSLLTPDQLNQTLQQAVESGLIFRWRNDINKSHERYWKSCKPEQCKVVYSQKTPFTDAFTAALAVLGGAATGIKILVGLIYSVLRKVYKIPEVDAMETNGAPAGGPKETEMATSTNGNPTVKEVPETNGPYAGVAN
jgi:hypothetical protein